MTEERWRPIINSIAAPAWHRHVPVCWCWGAARSSEEQRGTARSNEEQQRRGAARNNEEEQRRGAARNSEEQRGTTRNNEEEQRRGAARSSKEQGPFLMPCWSLKASARWTAATCLQNMAIKHSCLSLNHVHRFLPPLLNGLHKDQANRCLFQPIKKN